MSLHTKNGRPLQVSGNTVYSRSGTVVGDVKVVKVNHHGSPFSCNATYVNTLQPEIAVISVGKNSFGHPSKSVVNRWEVFADIFQT
jgi:beta-lactamase superfamily II metal-dependent hydrolase